jgi:fructose-bisphosphate aldolase class II
MSYDPLPGARVFEAVKDRKCILMAANPRMAYVLPAIFRAAKDTDSAMIVEFARSEGDLEGGYTGLTPDGLSKRVRAAAEQEGYKAWSLHADHITVKKTDPEEIAAVKKLIEGQIRAGYTSFAIDASYLFDISGADEAQQLKDNIAVTTELAKFIEEKYGSKDFGLEVEVGEVGKKDANGLVLTTPAEATTFIKILNSNGIDPHVIAIANGCTHGNLYDEHGHLIEQVSINIPQTIAVAKALRDMGSRVRIAQHGITGTPRELIYREFPHGDIIKGNVATFWQNLVFDSLKMYEPELYKRIWGWVMENYKGKNPGKAETEIFGKNSKKAIKVFFDDIYKVSDETQRAIDAKAYAEALWFFKAFRSKGTAPLVLG